MRSIVATTVLPKAPLWVTMRAAPPTMTATSPTMMSHVHTAFTGQSSRCMNRTTGVMTPTASDIGCFVPMKMRTATMPVISSSQLTKLKNRSVWIIHPANMAPMPPSSNLSQNVATLETRDEIERDDDCGIDVEAGGAAEARRTIGAGCRSLGGPGPPAPAARDVTGRRLVGGGVGGTGVGRRA